MQLQLKRTQREAGVISKSVIFCLDARAQLTPEERGNLSRYKLYDQVIYNSASAQRSRDKSAEHLESGTASGMIKGLAHLAITALKLNITVGSLERGHHIECKDMDELLAAEDALYTACGNLKIYLDVAATFDGSVQIVDFNGDQPASTFHAAIGKPDLIVPAPLPPSQQAPPQLTTITNPAGSSHTEVIEDAIVEAASEERTTPFIQGMMSSFDEAPEHGSLTAEPEPVQEYSGRYAEEFGDFWESNEVLRSIKEAYEKNPVPFWFASVVVLLFFVIKLL